jgi:polyisoprenoid-binding protein YceI
MKSKTVFNMQLNTLRKHGVKMRTLSPLFVALLLGTASIAAAAGAVTLGKASASEVKFTATGPGGLTIVGESSALQVSDDAQIITVSVPLEPLHTGIGLRDRHMKEKYLEVAKYPAATLKIDHKSLSFPGAGKSAAGDAQGDMTLHGATKHVRFHYDARAEGAGYDVTSTLHLNMNDFGISVPSYLGMSVKPDVSVDVKFHVENH